MLARLRLGIDNTTSSGVVAFGMMFRAIVIMIVLLAVAASNKHVGLTARAALRGRVHAASSASR